MSTILENAHNFWNEWEIRILVLLSLFLQIMLILLAPWRHYLVGWWINILLWLSYLSADLVATLSLGILARNQYDGQVNNIEANNDLMALWAPFLVLHLGGPDTITAYSLEDNELWPRHLLGLLTQVTVAFYILCKFWTNGALSYVNILILAAGIIKYGERTWVLYSASMKNFQISEIECSFQHIPDNEHIKELQKSYILFEDKLKSLFADRILTGHVLNSSLYLVRTSEGAECHFRRVELALKFLYDVLYTKVPINYTAAGLCLRIICSLSLISALLIFIAVDKHMYMKPNVYVTYFLLIGSVVLDIWAFVAFILSDWTKLWLTKRQRSRFLDGVYRLVMSCDASCAGSRRKRQWSRQVPQHSLIDFCTRKQDAKCLRSDFMFDLKRHWDVKWEYVDDDMIDFIYKKIIKKKTELKNALGDDHNTSFKIMRDGVLHRREGNLFAKYNIPDLETEKLEFNISVIAWHVATTACLYLDDDNQDGGETSKQIIMSKRLSDYIFSLLVLSPTLMPKWYEGSQRMEKSYTEALSYLSHKIKSSSGNNSRKEEIKTFLRSQSYTETAPPTPLILGKRLAKKLENNDRKWSFLRELWATMLIYAAGQCEWREQAKRLPCGGELLTHVSLIMAHNGLSYQYENIFITGPIQPS